jgi:chloride channel 7
MVLRQELLQDFDLQSVCVVTAPAPLLFDHSSSVGGVLFALEEGASFWSSSLTFRTFFCAMVTMLTVNIVFQSNGFGVSPTSELFVFGEFVELKAGVTNFRTYELFIFIIMGVTGGLIGAMFNHVHLRIAAYYGTHMATPKQKVLRVVLFTIAMCCVSFIIPLMWQKCTKLPTDEETASWGPDELAALARLVQYQCKAGHYNELASLYFVGANQCIQVLFHFREYTGTNFATFSAGPLVIFFVSYFGMVTLTGGLAIPMGLFVPSLVAGAAYGRLWGHLLNLWFPHSVADSGTYALMGSAAINGGVTRLALAMTIIMLETAGNMTYLLPLMVTFGAARSVLSSSPPLLLISSAPLLLISSAPLLLSSYLFSSLLIHGL